MRAELEIRELQDHLLLNRFKVDQKRYLHCLAMVLSPGMATVLSSTSIGSSTAGNNAKEGEIISTGDSGILGPSTKAQIMIISQSKNKAEQLEYQ